MTHTYRQHLSMAGEATWKIFRKDFKEKPIYSVVRIPKYILVILLSASVYHSLDVPTPEELEQDIKAARQRKSQLEGALSKLKELSSNSFNEH